MKTLSLTLMLISGIACAQTIEEVTNNINELTDNKEQLEKQLENIRAQITNQTLLLSELQYEAKEDEPLFAKASGNADIKESLSQYAKTLSRIKINEVAEILDYDNANMAFLIKYENKTGYVNSDAFTNDLGAKKMIVAHKLERANEKDKEKIIQEAEKEYFKMVEREQNQEEQKLFMAEKVKKRQIDIIKKYGEHNGNRILNRKVWVGMTADMAKDSWGTPKDINRTTTANYVKEQWIYGDRNYLYFENEILTTVQN